MIVLAEMKKSDPGPQNRTVTKQSLSAPTATPRENISPRYLSYFLNK